MDVSEALVASARELHPDAEFFVGDCASGLPLPDAAADVVAALGWLHWEPRYAAALAELWRLTRHRLFFDVRLHDGDSDISGTQAIPGLVVPYICFSWKRFAELLERLKPGLIRAYGYLGPPSDSVRGMPNEICFAAFVVERGRSRPTLDLELPFAGGDR